MDRIELVHCDTLSCEAIVRRAPNGELILVCQCGGTGEPMPENRVYVFHSADGGRRCGGGNHRISDRARRQVHRLAFLCRFQL